MRKLILALTAGLCLALPGLAQESAAPTTPDTTISMPAAPELTGLAKVIADNADEIAKSSRKTIGPVIEALSAAGEGAPAFLAAWADKRLGQRKSDGAIYVVDKKGSDYVLTDPVSGAEVGTAPKSDISEIKPNSGVRGLIASALVQFQLSDPDPAQRRAAMDSLAREGSAEHLAPLRASIESEPDPAIRAQKERLEGLLTIRFGATSEKRVAAIESFGADMGLDYRAALNPIVATSRVAFDGAPEGNVARELRIGRPKRLSRADMRAALETHIDDGKVGGVPLAETRCGLYRAGSCGCRACCCDR